jgi:hypothetical protein
MMLKANNEFLEFNDLIEVEKQIKLFEDISTTDGDFSYSFDLAKTLNNSRILGNPFPDNILKPVYQKIPAQLLTEQGAETFDGYIRIEKITNVYQCSFFAGNNNWFGLLADPLRSLSWKEYDIVQSQATIQASFLKTSGVVFPLMDNGILAFRGAESVKVEDFVAGIYVKDVFNKVFGSHGIKIQGELLNDATFLNSITVNNNKNAQSIADRSSFVRTTNAPTAHSSSTYVKIDWTDDTSHPYFDGSADNFSLVLDRYTADIPMIAKFEWVINNLIVPSVFGEYRMAFYLNGVLDYQQIFTDVPAQPLTITKVYTLDAGDYVEAFVWDDSSIFSDPLTDSTIRVTPIYVYKVFGVNVVPDWSQQEYVSNVIRLFNVLSSYDSKNKTLTLNLLEKITDKPAVDLSPHISSTEIDYSEFISDYGKKSMLSFGELQPGEDFINLNYDYTAYSKGEIDINNDFLDDSVDILESGFTNPITYLHPVFDMSLEKTDLITTETQESVDVTGVTNSAGLARFAVSEDVFVVSDLVRVSDSTNVGYNGDFKVYAVGSGYIELIGLNYSTTATAKIDRIRIAYTDSDNVFFLRNVSNYEIPKFSSRNWFVFEDTDVDIWGLAFFSLIDTGKQISKDFINSVSFSGDQRTLIDQYFRLATGMLNDPVKLFCEAYIPYDLFMRIDFLSPIKILTEETQNLYYLNRITGYKDSFYGCTLELIKLSSKFSALSVPNVVPDPPVTDTPIYVQNANTFFQSGSTSTLTYTFSTNLISTNRVIGIICCRTKTGVPETNTTVNQGVIDSLFEVGTYGTSTMYLFQISGFPGSSTSLVLTFASGNRPSDTTGCAFEIEHGHLAGDSVVGGSSSNSTTQLMPAGFLPDVYSMVFCAAAFNAVPGFTDVTDPSGVTQNPVTGNNAAQSCYASVIFPAGSFPAQPEFTWANSVGSILAMYEIIYI